MHTNRPLRALIVEDSEDDTLLLADYLQHHGYALHWSRVDRTDTLEQALEREPWDIVLSDYTMPRFRGDAALELIRRRAPELPFIFVSGTIGEERAVAALQAGAQDFVMKGNFDRLVPAVERALDEVALRRRQRAAEQARDRLVAILEATTDLVATAGADGRLNYLNSTGRNLLGVARFQEIAGRRLEESFTAWSAALLRGEGFSVAQRLGVWQGELALRGRDGSGIPVSTVVLAHQGDAGEVAFFSVIARDVSERKRFEAELLHQATHDALTELANRVLLADRLQTELSRARRTQRKVGVIFLDLDNFKRVNDSLGHAAGDALLTVVAQRFKSILRPNDTVARYGGDEFTVIIGDLSRSEDLLIVDRKLRAQSQEPIHVANQELYITFSSGIAVYPEDGRDGETLLKNADAAMYRAKSRGRDQHQFYSPDMNARGQELLGLEAELRRALERGEFVLHYQPQLALQGERIVGFEALLRWRRPSTAELVSPESFIPLLEENGLIVPVGEWVLRQACAHWRAGLSDQTPGGRIAVNVSARQFNDKGFVDMVARTLAEEDVKPEMLELEITESTVMTDVHMAGEILASLDALGVRLSLDDFGTGYSSLAYLKRFPLDVLKIDRVFVRDLPADSNDMAITQASISLAHGLGLQVLAEGVESAEQRACLLAEGCDLIQGYHLSPPLAGEQISPFMQGRVH